MSAPDTNIERQQEQHKPALLGIKGAMIFGAAMMIAVFGYAMLSTGDSGATAYQGGSVQTSTDG